MSKTTEEVLRDKVKFIGDGEWTLLGTPAEVIAEINNAFVETVQRMADDVSPNLLLNEIVGRYYAPINNIEEVK